MVTQSDTLYEGGKKRGREEAADKEVHGCGYTNVEFSGDSRVFALSVCLSLSGGEYFIFFPPAHSRVCLDLCIILGK